MPTKNSIYKLDTSTWTVERIVFLIAGCFVFLSVLLAVLWDRRFIYFAAFVGAMLINFALSGYCPMAMLVAKIKSARK